MIAAEGEQKASRALREAAAVIAESPSALQVIVFLLKETNVYWNVVNILQLRYLQTLSTISAEHNSTIIFPMPVNIMDHFVAAKKEEKIAGI